MELRKKLSDFVKKKNNTVILIILIIGTLFMVLPDKKDQKPHETLVSDSYSDEARLEKILSLINGTGDVKVMVTYSGTEEKRLAYETKSGKNDRGDSGYEENLDKQVVMSSGEPFVASKIYPKVKGVVVIAEGAENSNVRAAILEAVTTAFSIAPHKVCILEK